MKPLLDAAALGCRCFASEKSGRRRYESENAMTRLGTCAACGGDIMLVTFDDANGCRFCMGCGRARVDAVIRDDREDEEPTQVSGLLEIDDDDPTVVGPPDAMLLSAAKGTRP